MIKQVHKRKILEISETNLADTSKVSYEHNLKQFFEFSGIKDTNELIHITNDDLQDALIDYVQYLNTLARTGKLSNNTVPKRFKGIKYILDVNYRENDVAWRPIRAQYPEKVRLTGFKPYTSEQIQEMLTHEDRIRNRTFIHFMSSVGARIGIHDHALLIKHLVPMTYQNENDCYAVLLYSDKDLTPEDKETNNTLGNNDEYSYYGFLTPEATKALKKYFERREKQGEILDGNSPVFRTFEHGKYNQKGKVQQLTRKGAISLMFRIVSKSGVNREKQGRRYNIQMDHGFRKRFNTILKLDSRVNSNIAEKLMAHKRGLDGTYLTPTRDECFKEFVKAITQLTIDQKQRDKILIEEQKNEINQLKKAHHRIDVLEDRIAEKNADEYEEQKRNEAILEAKDAILEAMMNDKIKVTKAKDPNYKYTIDYTEFHKDIKKKASKA